MSIFMKFTLVWREHKINKLQFKVTQLALTTTHTAPPSHSIFRFCRDIPKKVFSEQVSKRVSES